jgi:hypothetical protein
MPRSPQGRLPRQGRLTRGRRASLPAVPTYADEAIEKVDREAPTPSPTAAREDPADEAIRRMIEAAYT